jgi:ribonuclease P protein component
VASFRFTKQAKLIKTHEFSSVFSFRKRISTPHLVLHYQLNALQHARLGLVIGKKTAKLAVSRNYMRRVLRELFRLRQQDISPVDLVIRVQKQFDRVDFNQIKKEFDELMVKLNKRTKPVTTAPATQITVTPIQADQ